MFDPNERIDDADKRSFYELDLRVKKLKEDVWLQDTWEWIKNKPLNLQSIDILIEQGCKINLNNFENSCSTNNLIGLKKGSYGYQRDKALFHELGHAWYSNHESAQRFPFNKLDDHPLACPQHSNRTIVEWMARQWRANPYLLRHTITSFGLEPQIYDAVSEYAFRDRTDANLVFINPYDLQTIMMD